MSPNHTILSARRPKFRDVTRRFSSKIWGTPPEGTRKWPKKVRSKNDVFWRFFPIFLLNFDKKLLKVCFLDTCKNMQKTRVFWCFPKRVKNGQKRPKNAVFRGFFKNRREGIAGPPQKRCFSSFLSYMGPFKKKGCFWKIAFFYPFFGTPKTPKNALQKYVQKID